MNSLRIQARYQPYPFKNKGYSHLSCLSLASSNLSLVNAWEHLWTWSRGGLPTLPSLALTLREQPYPLSLAEQRLPSLWGPVIEWLTLKVRHPLGPMRYGGSLSLLPWDLIPGRLGSSLFLEVHPESCYGIQSPYSLIVHIPYFA